MTAKYVIVKYNFLELAILFNPIFNHSDFKKVAERYGEIISAGECTITGIEEHEGVFETVYEPVVYCHGKSTTLELESRPKEDAIAIKRSFRKV